MNKLKKDNVVNFPSKINDIDREVEAIVFAAAESGACRSKYALYRSI